jgi:hypothetical protein
LAQILSVYEAAYRVFYEKCWMPMGPQRRRDEFELIVEPNLSTGMSVRGSLLVLHMLTIADVSRFAGLCRAGQSVQGHGPVAAPGVPDEADLPDERSRSPLDRLRPATRIAQEEKPDENGDSNPVSIGDCCK